MPNFQYNFPYRDFFYFSGFLLNKVLLNKTSFKTFKIKQISKKLPVQKVCAINVKNNLIQKSSDISYKDIARRVLQCSRFGAQALLPIVKPLKNQINTRQFSLLKQTKSLCKLYPNKSSFLSELEKNQSEKEQFQKSQFEKYSLKNSNFGRIWKVFVTVVCIFLCYGILFFGGDFLITKASENGDFKELFISEVHFAKKLDTQKCLSSEDFDKHDSGLCGFDRWFEIYNPNNHSVSLSGYSFNCALRGCKSQLSGTISAKGFFVIYNSKYQANVSQQYCKSLDLQNNPNLQNSSAISLENYSQTKFFNTKNKPGSAINISNSNPVISSKTSYSNLIKPSKFGSKALDPQLFNSQPNINSNYVQPQIHPNKNVYHKNHNFDLNDIFKSNSNEHFSIDAGGSLNGEYDNQSGYSGLSIISLSDNISITVNSENRENLSQSASVTNPKLEISRQEIDNQNNSSNISSSTNLNSPTNISSNSNSNEFSTKNTNNFSNTISSEISVNTSVAASTNSTNTNISTNTSTASNSFTNSSIVSQENSPTNPGVSSSTTSSPVSNNSSSIISSSGLSSSQSSQKNSNCPNVRLYSTLEHSGAGNLGFGILTGMSQEARLINPSGKTVSVRTQVGQATNQASYSYEYNSRSGPAKLSSNAYYQKNYGTPGWGEIIEEEVFSQSTTSPSPAPNTTTNNSNHVGESVTNPVQNSVQVSSQASVQNSTPAPVESETAAGQNNSLTTNPSTSPNPNLSTNLNPILNSNKISQLAPNTSQEETAQELQNTQKIGQTDTKKSVLPTNPLNTKPEKNTQNPNAAKSSVSIVQNFNQSNNQQTISSEKSNQESEIDSNPNHLESSSNQAEIFRFSEYFDGYTYLGQTQSSYSNSDFSKVYSLSDVQTSNQKYNQNQQKLSLEVQNRAEIAKKFEKNIQAQKIQDSFQEVEKLGLTFGILFFFIILICAFALWYLKNSIDSVKQNLQTQKLVLKRKIQ